MTYHIKELISSDLLLAKQLIQIWQVDDGIKKPSIPDDDYLNKLLSSEEFHVFVAMENNELAGGLTGYELKMFGRESSKMLLYEIGVHQKFRRKGIATRLIKEFKDYCSRKGINEIFVITDTANHAAQKLYEITGGEIELAPIFTYNLTSRSGLL